MKEIDRAWCTLREVAEKSKTTVLSLSEHHAVQVAATLLGTLGTIGIFGAGIDATIHDRQINEAIGNQIAKAFPPPAASQQISEIDWDKRAKEIFPLETKLRNEFLDNERARATRRELGILLPSLVLAILSGLVVVRKCTNEVKQLRAKYPRHTTPQAFK